MATDERNEDLVADAVEEIQLGDALGQDENLAKALPGMCDQFNSDAKGGWLAIELLKRMWSDYVVPYGSAGKKVFAAAVKRFTDLEVRKIKARGEAKIDAAKADKIHAEAEAIRGDNARKDKILECLLSQGIEMAAEERDGLLRVAFVKNPRESE